MEGREKERDTSMCETNIDRLPLSHPQQGTWLTTQASALPGNQTSDLSVCRMMPSPLKYTSQCCRLNHCQYSICQTMSSNILWLKK